MTNSSRFTVAVHVLTLLAYEEGRALTSDYIAGSVNTNPVVIRRVLGLLSKAGLISTTEGAGGGTVLAKPAKRISLADVLHAVEQGELFAPPPNDPNPLCPVGRCVQTILGEHLERLQGLLERAMKRVCVAELLEEVKSGSRR